MSNLKLSKQLIAVIAILAALGIGFYAGAVPVLLTDFVAKYPEFSSWFVPWLVFLIVTALPLYAILAIGVFVARNIGADKSFVRENGRALRGVVLCLLFEAVYFLAGNAVLWLMGFNHPGIVLASVCVSLFAVLIAAAFRVLAGLLEHAVELREENESFV